MITIETKVHFGNGRRGRRKLAEGKKSPSLPTGRVPRVSKMMALAIRLDGLIREGAVKDQAELARLGHVTRARLTQIMNLLHLAPDIQEAVLYLPDTVRGHDEIKEHELRAIAAVAEWGKQRQMWNAICARPA